jgi:hypothetical protein
MQQWDRKSRHWEPRQLKPVLPGFDAQEQQIYAGSNGCTYKLGRAVPLRKVSKEKFRELTRLREHEGPFLPVVMEACREDQQSFEYAEGAVTQGAFTFALVEAFKEPEVLSFRELERSVAKRLKDLGIDQQPQIVGPKQRLDGPIAGWDRSGGNDGGRVAALRIQP